MPWLHRQALLPSVGQEAFSASMDLALTSANIELTSTQGVALVALKLNSMKIVRKLPWKRF